MARIIADYSGETKASPKRYRVEEKFRDGVWKSVSFHHWRMAALSKARLKMIDGPAYGFYYRVVDSKND